MIEHSDFWIQNKEGLSNKMTHETISPVVVQELLQLARQALIAYFTQKPMPSARFEDPLFQEKRGIFVTLMNAGELRGCIGTFQPEHPLVKTLCEYAVASAQDRRFLKNPVTLQELPQLQISISILSPLRRIQRLEEIQIGTHGIRVGQGKAVGCFLPEVATEQAWDRQEFVEYCLKHKAHLPAKSWQDPKTQIEVFTTTKIEEKSAAS